MQVLSSTGIAVALVLLYLWRGPYRGLPVLLGMAPLGAMAAFNLPGLGGASIIGIDLAVATAFGLLLLWPGGVPAMLGTMRPWRPGLFLILLFGWAVVATAFLPRVFTGATEVYSLSRTGNEDGIVIQLMRPGTGNVTQLFRLTLGVMAFFAAAAFWARRPDPTWALRGLMAATAVHVAMGLIDVLSFSLGQTWVMEPFRTANYAMAVEHRMAGLKRMVGGFPEASAFGDMALGLFGFWFRHWVGSRGGDGSARLSLLFLLASTFVLLRSTSSSAYVGAAIFLVVMASAGLVRQRRASVSRRAALMVGGVMALLPLALALGVAAYETVEPVRAFLDRALFDKLGTDSGVERLSWNVQALRNFADSHGLGLGLGSVRSSSLVTAALATLGVIGAGLLLLFLAALLGQTARDGDGPRAGLLVSALQAGCLALLIRACLSGTSVVMDLFFFTMAGLAAGLAAGRVGDRHAPGAQGRGPGAPPEAIAGAGPVAASWIIGYAATAKEAGPRG